jgi:hypothetical protein
MFANWLESQQFKRLIPPEVLDMIPILKQQARSLTQQYNQDKSSVEPYVQVYQRPDQFLLGKLLIIDFMTAERWNELGLRGQGLAGIDDNGNRRVLYRIPMVGYDTIYHELVHAFDPKLAEGIPQGSNPNILSHEVDAYISGHIDDIKDRLRQETSQEAQRLLGDLKNWLRKAKTDFDPWNLPELLRNMTIYHYYVDKKRWRKFVSIINNELFNA